MVRLDLRSLLARKGLTAYRLAKTSGLSLTTVYRLTRTSGRFGRIDSTTIDRICSVLGVAPGELFIHTPERSIKRVHWRAPRARLHQRQP